jgi:HK97 gp10 family phage protein
MGKPLSIELLGYEELHKTLADFAPKEARNVLRAAVQALAGRVRDQLRVAVKKDTRSLSKSIRSVRRRGTENEIISEVRGGATAPYMLMLEYGTSKTKAQPFIGPTVEQIRPDLPRFYKEEFGKKFTASVAKQAAKSVAKLAKAKA